MAQNKAFEMKTFEGGMNDHADARDIEDNQVALLDNLLVTNKGVIRVGYSSALLGLASYPYLFPSGSAGIGINTRNLWVYKNDFNASLNETDSEWLLASDGNKLYRLEINSSVTLAFNSSNIVVAGAPVNTVIMTIANAGAINTNIANSSITITDADGGDQATGAFEAGTTISSDGSNVTITWNSSDALGASATGTVTINRSLWTEIVSFGLSTPSHSIYPNLAIYDGNIRYSDGQHILDGSSPYLPLTTTKFYGQVRRKYLDSSTNTVSTIEGDTSIIKPTDGIVNFNKDVEIAANNPARGYLGLEVDKLEHTILDSISFGTDLAPTDPDDTGNTTYDTMSINDEVTALGEIMVEINSGTLANSILRDMQVNKSYSFDDISAGTQVSFDASGWLAIGNNSTGDSSECTFFITLDEGTDSYEFGTIRRSLRINGTFQQSSSNVNYSNLDYEPNIFPIDKDGTVGSELTILTGNNTNGQPNKDDGYTLYANYRFEDTSKALKYKVTLKAGANEQIRLETLQIFQSLAPITSDSTLAKFARLSANGSAQSDGHEFEFDNIFATSLQTNDSLMFLRIAFPYGNVRNTSEWAPTSVKLKFSTSPANDNYRLYVLSTEWITDNKLKGWIDLPIDLKEIADITGSASVGELDCLRIELYKDNFSSGSHHDMFIDLIAQTEDKRGTWDGYYKFYYSWVYDRIQESGPFEFPNQGDGMFLSGRQLESKVVIRELSNGGFGARGKRITGANVYFAEYDNINDVEKTTDPFLFLQCDFEKGVKKINSQTMSVWSVGETATDHYTHSKIKFIDPSLSSTFSINSGYTYDPLNSIREIRFRTATNLNRRLYYGNVDILWEKFSGETNYKRNKYQDRVYKSLSNKPDIVPHYNYLDIDINDGDEITALASYADRLLVFKKNMMYLVNATKEMEFLEDKYLHKGVVSDQCIVETDIGIAWANTNGAYHYDGEKVVDLTLAKIKQSTFTAQTGPNPTILYEPKERHLIILSKSSVNGWICDLDTGAWSKTTTGVSGDTEGNATNSVLYSENIVMAAINDNSKFTFNKIAISNANDESITFDLKTKDLSLNEVGGKADVKAIYVTYKSTTNGSSNPQVGVKYFKNKSTSATNLTNGDLADTSGGYSTVKLVPNPKTGGRSLNTIQLRFYGIGTNDLAFKDFELHDISIIYKEKSLK